MRKPELVMFEIEGAEMAVRLAGDREKPALLLIHGFPSSSESFRNVIGTLARDCFVITPDLPGFGGSEPVEPPAFSRFADMIHGLLAARRRVLPSLSPRFSWMKALPRMEAHILDGPHFLLQTHPAECAALMSAFVRRAEGQGTDLCI